MKIRNKYLLVLAMAWGPCLLLAAASYAVVLRPQLDYRKELEAKIAGSKEQYARALAAAREKNQELLATQLEGLRRRVADFVVRLDEAPDLAFKIGTLANTAGLESFNMKPANKMGPETLPETEYIMERRVDLTFAASFQRFAAFLNTLERHRPVLFVETFALSRPLDKDAEPQASMELAVLVEKGTGSIGVSR
jgi:Tfp pilus assembly protein PilO